jgi:hypothetical protein
MNPHSKAHQSDCVQCTKNRAQNGTECHSRRELSSKLEICIVPQSALIINIREKASNYNKLKKAHLSEEI